MADERIIRIKIESGGEPSSMEEGQQDNTSKYIRKFLKVLNNPIGEIIDAMTMGKNALFSRVLVEATEDLIQATKYSYTRRWQLKENYEAENNYANAMAVINKSKSLLGQVASWTLTGAMAGGGIGAVVGLAVGAVSAGVKEAMEYQKKNDAMTRQLNEQNIRTQYSAKRLGLVDNSRGTEN